MSLGIKMQLSTHLHIKYLFSVEQASTDRLPGVDISVPELPVLAVTKRVDISVLHQHNWKAT